MPSPAGAPPSPPVRTPGCSRGAVQAPSGAGWGSPPAPWLEIGASRRGRRGSGVPGVAGGTEGKPTGVFLGAKPPGVFQAALANRELVAEWEPRCISGVLGSACVFTLLGCSFTCFCLACSDELFSNYTLCRSDTSGTCRVSGRWALTS